MKKCYSCGISEDETFLYEGVSKQGFVNVCRKCYVKSEIPLIGKKNVVEAPTKNLSVRERLMGMAGMKANKKPETSKRPFEDEEVTLKDLIEKNFKKEVSSEKKDYYDLAENFHWIVMRKRRMQKLTQEDFAKKIFEPLIVMEHLEKGILPKDYYGLIKKVENALSIRLFKEQSFQKFDPSNLASESKISSGLMVSDLKEIQNQSRDSQEIKPEELSLEKVEEIVGKAIEEEPKKEKKKRSWFSSKEKPKEEDVSQEDIESIMFRR